MGVRPGRVLPSVIVGGLLATGLAVGAGSANAAALCKIGSTTYDMTGASDIVSMGGKCAQRDGQTVQLLAGRQLVNGVLTPLYREVKLPKLLTSPTDGLEVYVPVTTPTAPVAVPADSDTSPPTSTEETPDDPVGDSGEGAGTGRSSGSPDVVALGRPGAAVPAPAPAPAPAAAAPVDTPLAPAGDLLSPLSGPGGLGGFASMAPLGAGVPGAYDPGLLLAPGIGSPTAKLLGGDPASSVTTASNVQAMAFGGLPRGVGLPAMIGVLILTTLGALVLRHQMFVRLRRRATAAGVDTSGETEVIDHGDQAGAPRA